MYLTVQEEDLESIIGEGASNGLGMSGLSRAPLNLTMKKKHPRKTPCGEDPGRRFSDEVAPLNFKVILLFFR